MYVCYTSLAIYVTNGVWEKLVTGLVETLGCSNPLIMGLGGNMERDRKLKESEWVVSKGGTQSR